MVHHLVYHVRVVRSSAEAPYWFPSLPNFYWWRTSLHRPVFGHIRCWNTTFHLYHRRLVGPSNRTTQNAMTFNTAKCKFMKVSRKRTTSSLNGCILEEVPTFKYLSILISSDLSWCQHIQSACTKAGNIIGLLIYRHYCRQQNVTPVVYIITETSCWVCSTSMGSIYSTR